MNLFFVVNQDIADGSAHALYCVRHCWWLAATNDQCMVHLLFPGRLNSQDALTMFCLQPLPNLRLNGLPCLRRPRGRRGITVNAVYYWAAAIYLYRFRQPGDILVSASFPKLFRFLASRKKMSAGMRIVYEVHQLACLEHGAGAKSARMEQEALDRAEVIVSMTQALHEQTEMSFPTKIAFPLGLGCGFDPEAFPQRIKSPEECFTLAYIGSLYTEQGVSWLLESWPEIQKLLDFPVRLMVLGGPPPEVERLRRILAHRDSTVDLLGPVPPGRLADVLQGVDALVIPALNMGRMPYVAITKAHDYLGLNRPILAANLPSVQEVLRQGREALLFAPGDQAGLAESLQLLHDDADLVSRLVANCRIRCGQYSWEARARRWWEVVGG